MSDPIIILLSVPLTKLHQRNLRQQRVSNINQSIFLMMLTKSTNQISIIQLFSGCFFKLQIFNTVYLTILESSNGNVFQ